MHFLGKDSHAYVKPLGDGYFEVGNILFQVIEVFNESEIKDLEYLKPLMFDFLTYDEFEQLKMYFV